MSLINEALRKARFEAARQEAADAGLPYPTGEARTGRRNAPLPWVLAALAGLALVAATGGLLFWLGQRSAGSGLPVAEGVAGEPVEPTVVSAQAPEAVGAGPHLEADGRAPTPVEPSPTARPQAAAAATDTNPRAPERGDRSNRPQPAAARSEPSGPEASEPGSPDSARRATEAPVESAPIRDPIRQQAAAAQSKRSSEPSPAATAKGVAPAAETAVPEQQPNAPSVPEERIFVGEAEVAGGVVRLEGIAWSRDRPFALINGRVVGAGDHVESLTITKVERRRILLRDDSGSTYILRLR